MKIIDLLNKIANGEEVPEKIIFHDQIYYYHKGYDFDYAYTTDKGGFLLENNSLFQFSSYKNNFWNDNSMIEFLNDEVVIIEDTPKKDKIEKITWKEKESLANKKTTKIEKLEVLARRTEVLKKRFNELINKVNEMSDDNDR